MQCAESSAQCGANEEHWRGNCFESDTPSSNSADLVLTLLPLEAHMKRIAAVALAFGVAGAPAFAEPVKMSEAQLDQVAAGLADVSVSLTNG